MIRSNAKSNKKQAKEQWFDSECSLLRNLSNKKLWKKSNSTKNKYSIKIKDGNVWKNYFSNLYLNPENNGLNIQISIID